jgi:hypothetical protein
MKSYSRRGYHNWFISWLGPAASKSERERERERVSSSAYHIYTKYIIYTTHIVTIARQYMAQYIGGTLPKLGLMFSKNYASQSYQNFSYMEYCKLVASFYTQY